MESSQPDLSVTVNGLQMPNSFVIGSGISFQEHGGLTEFSMKVGVPLSPKQHWSCHTPEGAALEAELNAKYTEYEKKYPEDAAELKSITDGVLPAGWEKALPTYTPETPADATRNLSQTNLNALAAVIPGLIGGSACFFKHDPDENVLILSPKDIDYGVS